MAQIRIAVIGAGLVGRRHADLVSASVECDLAAICDLNPAAGSVAQQYDVPYFQDYTDLLEQVPLDGAIIATPNAEHVPIGIACAQRDINLLVEKPIANTVAEGKRLIDAAARGNVQLMVGHYRRFHPLIQEARTMIRRGDLGSLVAVSVLWTLQKPDAYYDAQWRTQPGGGPILINIIHDIDNLRFICGEIKQIYALTSSGACGHAVEDTATISCRFSDGALGPIILSDATPSPWSYELTMFENPDFAHAAENCYFFMGDRGSLAFPRMELWHYASAEQSGWNHPLEKQQLRVQSADPLREQLSHFCRVIRLEELPLVNGLEGLRTLAATLAVHESARLNRPVCVLPSDCG